MKKFTSVKDVDDISSLIKEALTLKQSPFAFKHLGANKTLGLIFLNPSLRTRLSTQKAAMNLGMNVIVLNIDKEGWQLEMQDGAVMNGTTVEHVKDAATVIGMYCDIVGIRCFPGLKNKEEDYTESVLNKFLQYCKCPLVSLESATLHPLQSLADAITITEHWKRAEKPKVVLTWAPHIKPLPQAVANSFAEWMLNSKVEFVIAHPPGYELAEQFTKNATITHSHHETLEDADFIYVKNWSSYSQYGTMPPVHGDWLLTPEKLEATNDAKVMHCLPVRRNVEVPDSVLDSPSSLIYKQAENRVYAAQAVLKRMLENN